jgi:energy-converting hydrogenase Eha subunit A
MLPSRMVTVKVNRPELVAVPEMMPVELPIAKPLGRPLETDHVNGVLPPIFSTGCEYGTPVVAEGSEAVVIVSPAVGITQIPAAMLTVIGLESLLPAVLRARTK